MTIIFVYYLKISVKWKQRTKPDRANSRENWSVGSCAKQSHINSGQGKKVLPTIYRIVSLTSKSPWMTFWAFLSVGISEPPASQVQQRPQMQVDGFWKGVIREAQINSQNRELLKQGWKKANSWPIGGQSKVLWSPSMAVFPSLLEGGKPRRNLQQWEAYLRWKRFCRAIRRPRRGREKL